MFVTAYNRTETPAIIDDNGRVLGGFEWGPVGVAQQRAQDAVNRGALVIVDVDAPNLSSAEANAASDATAALEERAQAFDALDQDDYDAAVEAAGLAEAAIAAGLMAVGDETYELALSTVPVPGS